MEVVGTEQSVFGIAHQMTFCAVTGDIFFERLGHSGYLGHMGLALGLFGLHTHLVSANDMLSRRTLLPYVT